MNQEPESGGNKMTTESRPPVKAEQGQAKKQHRGLSGWDIAGIAVGAMIGCIAVMFILEGIWVLFTHYYPLDSLLFLGPGGISILLSVSLIIPGKYYERGAARTFGFAVSAFMAGGSIALPVLTVISAKEAWSLMEGSDPAALGPIVVFFFSVVATAFLVPSAVVLLKKLQPGIVETVATIIASVAVAALLGLAELHIFD
jgi:hypothetical protein